MTGVFSDPHSLLVPTVGLGPVEECIAFLQGCWESLQVTWPFICLVLQSSSEFSVPSLCAPGLLLMGQANPRTCQSFPSATQEQLTYKWSEVFSSLFCHYLGPDLFHIGLAYYSFPRPRNQWSQCIVSNVETVLEEIKEVQWGLHANIKNQSK